MVGQAGQVVHAALVQGAGLHAARALQLLRAGCCNTVMQGFWGLCGGQQLRGQTGGSCGKNYPPISYFLFTNTIRRYQKSVCFLKVSTCRMRPAAGHTRPSGRFLCFSRLHRYAAACRQT